MSRDFSKQNMPVFSKSTIFVLKDNIQIKLSRDAAKITVSKIINLLHLIWSITFVKMWMLGWDKMIVMSQQSIVRQVKVAQESWYAVTCFIQEYLDPLKKSSFIMVKSEHQTVREWQYPRRYAMSTITMSF